MSAGKRMSCRVTFEDRGDEVGTKNWTGENMETVSQQDFKVEDILALQAKGKDSDGVEDDNQMKAFVQCLQDEGTDEAKLTLWIHDLCTSVFSLGINCKNIVNVLLSKVSQWLDEERGEAFVQEYQSLLHKLATIHGCYLHPILTALVKTFTCPSPAPDKARKDKILHRVHKVLMDVTHSMKSEAASLVRLLRKHFPYMAKDADKQLAYVENLLHIATYIPTVQQDILLLVVDKMITIDVNCSRQEIVAVDWDVAGGDALNMEEKNSKEIAEEIFAMEEDKLSSIVGSTKPAAVGGSNEVMNHELANKLDCMMEASLRFIHNTCHDNGELSLEECRKLYQQLLYIFDRIIVPTHACSHVQFLLFYLLSFTQAALYSNFLEWCWNNVQDPATESILRPTYMAYLSGLLARASYIPITIVKECLRSWCAWVHRYIMVYDAKCTIHPNISQHATFYAVCQAIFYIVAFRQNDFVNSCGDNMQFMKNLNFESLVNSRLNPLGVCVPAIVSNFASFTRLHQIVYCYSIIEHNNRSQLRVVDKDGNAVKKNIEALFPFDPCMLKRSHKYIHAHFKEFDGNHSDSDCASCDEDMDDDDLHFTPTEDTFLTTSPSNFLMSSISPGFRHS